MEYGERGEERTRLFNDPPQIIRIFPQIDSNQEMNRISLNHLPAESAYPPSYGREREKSGTYRIETFRKRDSSEFERLGQIEVTRHEFSSFDRFDTIESDDIEIDLVAISQYPQHLVS